MSSAFATLTVLSRSPWKTMVGMVFWVSDLAALTRAPSRIAFSAEGKSLAAPQGSPECTPTAA
jgi:hypothetical protein